MNFYGKFSKVDSSLLLKVNKALTELYTRLKGLDIKHLSISEYNQRYLAEHVQEFEKTSWFLSHIFIKILENRTDLSQLTIVDYGGGSGVVSYFARILGIGTVIYNDIYDVSCSDVDIISKKMECPIDYIVEGDVNNVVAFINDKNLQPDFIIAQDVIEHIYNVKQWFTDIQRLKSDNYNVICTSHANKYNYLINRKLSKTQKRAEQFTRNKQWGHKERDSLKSFFEIRKEIINQHFNGLNDQVVNKLSKFTRGLIKEDIIAVVENYEKTGQLNYSPNHKTNTCDPLTGNWIEQFIDLKDLKIFLSKSDLKSSITSGYYISSKGSAVVRFLKTIVNYKIKLFGFAGLYLAPYYLIISTFNKNRVNQ